MNNKYITLIVTGLIASVVGMLGSQVTSALTLPAKVNQIEYRLEKIEGGVGTIESIVDMTNTDLKSLTRVLIEKENIK